MRSVLAGLRQLVIPWGAGTGADRIEIGGSLPADLVAFYLGFNITLIGGTVYYHAPDEYTYSVLGISGISNTLRWHHGVRNTQGITDAMTITPFASAREAFVQFGILANDVVNVRVRNPGSELQIEAEAALRILGSNTQMSIGTAATLTINSTAGTTTIDNATVFDGGSVTTFNSGSTVDVNGDVTASSLRPVSHNQTTASTTTSTTYGNLANIAGTAFTAPASGEVTIHYAALISNNTISRGAALTPWVGTGSTVGSGTEVVASSDDNAIIIDNIAAVSEGIRAGAHLLVTGLTPGTVYNVSMRRRAVGAGTASFDSIRTTVVPSP